MLWIQSILECDRGDLKRKRCVPQGNPKYQQPCLGFGNPDMSPSTDPVLDPPCTGYGNCISGGAARPPTGGINSPPVHSYMARDAGEVEVQDWADVWRGWHNTEPTYCVYWNPRRIDYTLNQSCIHPWTSCWLNVCFILCQRQRRWPRIEQTFSQKNSLGMSQIIFVLWQNVIV